jgi:hypothetical protein
MNYIITEDQQNKLIDIILRYLDSNLVPAGGWKDKKYYDSLDGYFGPRWQELFKRWFTKNTGLPVVYVDRQDW